jgi:hypothetical protein
MERTRLLAIEVELLTVLKAAESWHPSYKADPKLFKRLLKSESRMQQDMREYFKGLSGRVRRLVNWSEVYRRQTASEDVVVTVSDSAWQSEEELLVSILSPSIMESATVGALMAEAETGVSVGVGAANAATMKAVRQRSLELARGLNSTTRAQMKQAILQGVDAGENIDQIAARLSDLVDSEARAEMVAQTESVRANTLGKLSVASDIGAQFKVWEDGQSGECPICMSVDPKRIPVDGTFSTGDDGPPAHPRCRCGMSLDFATPEEAQALADGTWDAGG